MLKIRLKGKNRDAIWVVEKLYSIGSASNNSLVIEDASVSPVHAKLINKENKLYLKDNNSESGCYVNNQRITQKEVVSGDIIRLGKVEIEVLDPRTLVAQQTLPNKQNQVQWALVADSSWLSGREFTISGDRATIGRSNHCDITIPGTHLSRQHAEITIKENALQVRDLNSANGTFINDKRIAQGVAHTGDRLRFDVYSFCVVGPERDDEKAPEGSSQPRPVGGQKPQPNSQQQFQQQFQQQAQQRSKSGPKKWKTRPTSPGNYDKSNADQQLAQYLLKQRRRKLLDRLCIAMCVLMLGVAGYWAVVHSLF